MPLVALNRAFVVKGLVAIGHRANRGIAALADVARLGGRVTPYHLGFIIGPRINAGGRIGDAALGSRLLVSDDAGTCLEIAAELDRLNRERQEMEARMVEEAVAEADAEIGGGEGPAAIVTASSHWHPGVVGLIAARLKERFQRPAFAIALNPNGTGTGSGRSVAGIDLGHAVRSAVDAGILVKGGGHAMAAGITVSATRLADLRAYLETALASRTETDEARHTLFIDAALSARGATVDLIEQLDRAGPYGAGHPEPVFAFPEHRLSYVEEMTGGHLRLALSTGDNVALKGVAFRAAGTPLGAALLASRGESLHIAGALSVDTWQGRRQPSLRVLDAARPLLV